MFLFNPYIWPVFLIGLSLLITHLTSLDLPGKIRKSRRAGQPGEGTSDAPAVAKAKLPVPLRIVRNSGIFWFLAGVATIAHSLYPKPWIRPGAGIESFVGLFWMIIGGKLFRSTFPRRVAQLRLSGEDDRLPQIVTQLVDRELARGHVGLVVGAIAGEQEFLQGFGALRMRGTQPPDADTVFEIGSITKVFTGILLAQAIENGELTLDDRVDDLLPEGWSLPEPAWTITLRHCTTHTSGLPRLPANLLGISDILRLAYLGSDPYRDYTEEEFREALAMVKLNHEPGTRHEYSNFGAGLLGFILAKKYGSEYESLVKREICRPLGMDRTVITRAVSS